MRIDDLLATRVEKTPDKPFVRFPGAPEAGDADDATATTSSYSYREVAARAKQYATALRACGVTPGDRVAVVLPNRPEVIWLLFATAYQNSVLAPSNPAYTAGELQHALELSRPTLLVTTPSLAATAREAAAGTTVDQIVTTEATDAHDALPAIADAQSQSVDAHNGDETTVGLHMYTSGTTGPPKAVECQHENWTRSAIDFQKRMGFTTADTLFTALPLFHANAQIYSTLGAAAAGADVVIREQFSTSQWWDWCRAHGVTEFNAMGSMLKMLDNVPDRASDADNPVEFVFSAGTPPELIEPFEERFGVRVVEGYSLTEDPLLVLNPTDPDRRKIGSIGLPPAEKRLRIVDEDGTPCDPGEKGEIVQDCPALMAGYHRQPETTADAMEAGWFHTGDYGMRDADGFIYFLDRKKDIVRRGGENISSFQVEGVIKSLDAVDEVAVIPHPDEFYGEVVKALVKIKAGHDLSPTAVIDACRGELAPFKLPRYVEFVDEFPYTPTGKIQKQQLRDRERDRDPDHYVREDG